MVEVGSVAIRGSINSSDIERGFARIELSMDSVKGKAKGFTAELSRMSIISMGLASNLVSVGTSMAKGLMGTPALADEASRFRLTAEKFKRAMGEIVEPAVQEVATVFEKITAEVEKNIPTLKGIVEKPIMGTIKAVADAFWVDEEEAKKINEQMLPNEEESLRIIEQGSNRNDAMSDLGDALFEPFGLIKLMIKWGQSLLTPDEDL